jgi:hypothetical protein
MLAPSYFSKLSDYRYTAGGTDATVNSDAELQSNIMLLLQRKQQ